GDGAINLIGGRIEVVEDIDQVHFHMTFLDPRSHQRSEGGKILRQPSYRDDFHQPVRRRVAEQFEGPAGQRMDVCKATNGSDGNGYGQFQLKIAVLNGTGGQAPVLSVPCSVGMTGGFDRSEIVTGSED